MSNHTWSAILLWFLLLQGACAYAADEGGLPDGSVYFAARNPVGVILLHGMNASPKTRLIQQLQQGIRQNLDFHTLALKLPGDRTKPFSEYGEFFPAAYQRITQATTFLHQRQVTTVYLLGHKMGAKMAAAYIPRYAAQQYAGLIGLEIRNIGPPPLDTLTYLRDLQLPVLDVYGNANTKYLAHAHERRYLLSEKYLQLLIPDADVEFSNHMPELLQIVTDWLIAHSHNTL